MSIATTTEIRAGALYRLGLFLARHARAVLAIGLLLLLGAAVLGTRAFGELKSGGFDDPGSESYRAAQLSAEHFPSGPNLIVLVTAHDGPITGAASVEAGQGVTSTLATLSHVTVSASYFTTPVATLMSRDQRSALILLKVGGTQGQTVTRSSDVSRAVGGDRGAVSVSVGGSSGVFSDINDHVASSLVKAEAIAVPVTLLLLLLVFGSLVAALLPLLIGTFAIVGTFAELAVLGSITDVSVFAINLTTALGLGLGIDYGLLIVARFREQLASGQDVPEAVARTVATAGRTILFSAAAVAAALATLTLFPLYFLSSFGDAGVGVVIIAAAAALIVTPAALALLGHRVDKGRVPFVKGSRGSESPFWGRVARTVFRHPVIAATPVLALLLLAATPILGIHFALPDVTVLPTTAPSRVVADTLDAQFPSQANAVLWANSPGEDTVEAARSAAAPLVDLPGVTSVNYAGGTLLPGGATAPPDLSTVYSQDGYQRFAVNTSLPSGSEAARDLVAAVRGTPHGDYLIGGGTAGLADTLAGIARPLPLALGIIVVATFVLLFLFTGSVVQLHRECGAAAAGPVGQFAVVGRGGRDRDLGLSGRSRHPDLRCERPTDGRVHDRAAALHHVRAVHGLRGVPVQSDHRAAPIRRRPGHLGDRRLGPDRADREQRRTVAGGQLLRLHHLQREHAAAVRAGRRAGRADRRHPGPGGFGTGDHAATGPGQLLRPGTVAAAVRQDRTGRRVSRLPEPNVINVARIDSISPSPSRAYLRQSSSAVF